MSDIMNLSLTEVAAEIRAKRLTSVEVTEAALARIDAYQNRLNAFISLDRTTSSSKYLSAWTCCMHRSSTCRCQPSKRLTITVRTASRPWLRRSPA